MVEKSHYFQCIYKIQKLSAGGASAYSGYGRELSHPRRVLKLKYLTSAEQRTKPALCLAAHVYRIPKPPSLNSTPLYAFLTLLTIEGLATEMGHNAAASINAVVTFIFNSFEN